MADVTLIWNEQEVFRVLHSYTGPVGKRMARYGEIVKLGAQRRAPVSPAGSEGRPRGYLRSKVRWDRGRDVTQYVDISSPARTVHGEPVGLFMEVGTRPHIIRPKKPGGWLRWFDGNGKIRFARVVHHPGTKAQPHLRPALEDLRQA